MVAASATYGCRPCFNWKNEARRAAQLADGLTCGARGMARRGGGGGGGGDGGGGGFVTRAPSNGTLAAVFTCAGRMGESIGARQGGRARGKVHYAVLTTYYPLPPCSLLTTHCSLLTPIYH